MPADRGLIDTSLAVALGTLPRDRLPVEIAVSALTLAELASGPHAARDEPERSRRQAHLQQIEASFESLPFDAACARSYGPVYAAVALAGRKPRGPRAVDLMIAATAIAHQLPLLTRNAKDLRGLDDLLEVVDLGA